MLRAIFVDSFMFILSFFLRLILTLVVSTSVPKEFVYGSLHRRGFSSVPIKQSRPQPKPALNYLVVLLI